MFQGWISTVVICITGYVNVILNEFLAHHQTCWIFPLPEISLRNIKPL